MVKLRNEYIFRISLALTAGAGAGAAVRTAMTITYVIAALLMAVISTMMYLVTAGSERGWKHWGPLWTTVFFLLGMLCYCNRMCISISSPERTYFDSAGIRFTSVIEKIPFRNESSNALVLALLKGDRSRLDGKTVKDFRNAGAAHMLALSGMHLGIVYIILSRMLFILGNAVPARKARYVTITVLTLFYTLMCGAGASLVRAWLFILLDSVARILDRPQPPEHIFCVALMLHLTARPESICEAGFQLSYLAMAGIVFIWPSIRQWMESRIWDALSLSISCQLFTAPLTLLYFGTFPKYFLITNLVGAPLMSVVMAGGIIAAAASALSLEWPLLYTVCEQPVRLLCSLLGNIAQL